MSFRPPSSPVPSDGLRRGTLPAILMLATAMFATGIWWGVPNVNGTWAPDELRPGDVVRGMDQRFSGGWFHKYPPAHFYVLSATYLPVMAGAWLDILPAAGVRTLLIVVSRLVTLVMAVATIAIVYACGRRAYGPRAGAFAALIATLVAPLVYYAKLANIDGPYLLWLTLSLYFYLGILTHGRPRDYYGFAVAAVVAVCTKDQAYGFYVLPVAVVVFRALKRTPPAHQQNMSAIAGPTPRTLLISAALAAALGVLIYQLPWNWSGVTRHVGALTGRASEHFQIFEGSLAGHIEMALNAVWVLGWSLGWPMLILCVLGLLQELVRGDRARAAWLVLPALSYYAFFISVILYHYDRFFLGVCVILALFGGKLASTWSQPDTTRRRLKRVVLAGVFAVSATQAVIVDALMVGDSRYAAERWLSEHVQPGQRVVGVGLAVYLPRLDRHPRVRRLVSELERVRPDYVVVNADYASRFEDGSNRTVLYRYIRDGQGPYTRVYAVGPGRLHGVLRVLRIFPNDRAHLFTNIDKISPPIEVYKRIEPGR